jgi:protein tyrosine phosphatase (PTP) superfamily phosphohydrolase (DUF442 family)
MLSLYNYRQNTDLISSSGAVTQACFDELSKAHYQLVINLLPESSDKSLPDEQNIVEKQQIQYVHIPVDFNAPTEQNYQDFCSVLRSHPTQKIHIHCAANYRASAFFSAYFIESGFWTQAKAKSFLLDIWDPEQYPVWKTFLNTHLIDL